MGTYLAEDLGIRGGLHVLVYRYTSSASERERREGIGSGEGGDEDVHS
jgi:hypothetical protein